jgi:hypothetical protein
MMHGISSSIFDVILSVRIIVGEIVFGVVEVIYRSICRSYHARYLNIVTRTGIDTGIPKM